MMLRINAASEKWRKNRVVLWEFKIQRHWLQLEAQVCVHLFLSAPKYEFVCLVFSVFQNPYTFSYFEI